jgi:hypothetical protein
MAHTPRITAAVANAGMDAMFGGTISDLGIIEIWSDAGAQPAAGGGSSGTSVLLAELTMNATAWTAGASGGVLTASAITQDSSANASGTASWFRLKTAGGTALIDGSVGVGSGFDLNINSTAITSGGIVAANSLTITHPLL